MKLFRRNFKNSIQRWMMLMMVSGSLMNTFSSCSSDEEAAIITPSADSEVLFKDGISFASSKSEKIVTFTTNKDWKVNVNALGSDSGWCTVSPSQGKAGENSVVIRVTESMAYDIRTVSLILNAGELAKTITVTQKQKNTILPVNSEYEVAAEGGTVEIEMKTNVEYYYTVSGSDTQWIHEGSKSRGLSTEKVILSIDKSEEYNQREGSVTFHSVAYDGESITQVVKIIQKGTSLLEIPQKEYMLSAAGGNITIEMRSNFECEVKMPQVDWLTSVSTKGVSNRAFAYTVAPNTTFESRKAEIIYYDEKKTIEEVVTINQEPLSLLMDEQSVELMIGNQKQLSYKKSPNINSESLVWSSSNKSVAIVTQEGKVTAVSKGKSIITLAASNEITTTCEITVYELTDKIGLSILGNGAYINGYILGSAYSKITNNSNETIYLKTLKIYDGKSGMLVGRNEKVDQYLSPGESTNLGMDFNSVYLPIFVWTFTVNGVEYEVKHQYRSIFEK